MSQETQVGEWFIGDDFIGVFDTLYDTAKMIDLWKYHDNAGSTFDRLGFESNKDGRDREDRTWSSTSHISEHGISFACNDSLVNFQEEYNRVIHECLDIYRDRYATINAQRFQQIHLNIQRTQPGQGYHMWHCENSGGTYGDRVLATMMYLNTIPPGEGGETEFLYQSKRFNPVKGRVLIWPAGFTHTHRGNPPLKGDKYIATSWVMYVGPTMKV